MPKTLSEVLTEPEFVGKEYELKCLQDSQEMETEMEVVEVAVVIAVVVEVADSAEDVVDGIAEVAQEAEVENAAVLDGHHPTSQCQEAEVDQLPHQGEEDLDQTLVRINTR